MQHQRLFLIAILALFSAAAHSATTIENIRIWAEGGKTRVVLDLSKPADHSIFTLRGPDRLVVDLKDGRLASALTADMPDGAGAVSAIRSGVRANGQLRVVLDLNDDVRSRSFTAGPNNQYGDRLVIDLQHSGGLQTVKRASEAYRPGRDVIIAIDPGHGGYDPGSVGRSGTKEKDVALAVSKLLAARINSERGMRAVLVRSGDYIVDHRKRMDIAHKNDADLFVSIHADAFRDSRASGATVYALSLEGASDEEARLLAERENAAVNVGGVSLQDKDKVLANLQICHRYLLRRPISPIPAKKRSCATGITRRNWRTPFSVAFAITSTPILRRTRKLRWICATIRTGRCGTLSRAVTRCPKLLHATTSALQPFVRQIA
jgi:N-acetylmuramoyl-L-alanine amidase